MLISYGFKAMIYFFDDKSKHSSCSVLISAIGKTTPPSKMRLLFLLGWIFALLPGDISADCSSDLDCTKVLGGGYCCLNGYCWTAPCPPSPGKTSFRRENLAKTENILELS